MTFSEYIGGIKDKTIAVIGIGVSNLPLIERLAKCGCNVTACDKRSMEALGADGERIRKLGVELRLGDDYLEDLRQDIVFRTPGLMPFDEHLERAKELGGIVTSEMEVFFSVCPCPIIAVTGSDGKTTTSSIIAELLSSAGYTVHLGGNIGHPLLCEVDDIASADIVVLELSSFQLHSMSCHPSVAVITNLAPNHLDKHKDFQDYKDAKRAIFQEQTSSDRLILNLDDEHSEYYRRFAKSSVIYFSDKNPVTDGAVADGGVIYRVKNGVRTKIMSCDEIRLPGEHNVLNYLAAFCAVDGLVKDGLCRSVAMSFAGVEHRLETVRELRAVTYINDSIGTSPSRTSAGLRSMKTKPIVIAGGYDKHIPFDSLGDELCIYAKSVFLTGDTRDKILAAIKGSKYYRDSKLKTELVDDFDEAVKRAAASAEPGDIVLFSPACAAFDRFKNFAERGKHFKKLVMELN